VITIAFFNNKGGVGKTSLVYHVAWALTELGQRVLMADLDPQANLTALCLSEERLEELWAVEEPRRQTVSGAVYNLREELGDLSPVAPVELSERLGLLVGDIALSTFEAKLSEAWPKCLDRHAPSHRATGAFYRAVRRAADDWGAHVALIDVGPNLGAINRAALIAAEWVVTPLNADLFSIQGLRNLGPTLKKWRAEWAKRLAENPSPADVGQAPGTMTPAGYVIVQPSLHGSDVTKADRNWAGRVPEEYARALGLPPGATDVASAYGLAVVKHYRSLVPMAHEARKPIFHLTAGDGALGSHAVAARDAGKQFRELARRIGARTGLRLGPAAGDRSA
jgi:cellulose biosynthesis protein BcsQ